MTGIIINDSIVLVTSIDEHARERGLTPAIIDGAVDRLRAVLLTTLTTVLGLAPLLYEQSQQAQFLKPTVITLVYGLGFGMVLVLLVVPAMVAAQADVARQVAALRHGLRARGLRWPLWAGAGALAAWLGATMGWAAWTGALHPALLRLWPALAEVQAMPVAFGLFLAGAAALILMLFAGAAGVLAIRGRRLA